MRLREKRLYKKVFLEAYLAQINWDWLFLKGQLIFTGIISLGTIIFIFWFLL
ncbi:hypothetical protein V5739_16435 [Salinimicrobium sp. TIG7-5_MAKvit]|jgi:hypothetical protein|uniref:hypothetical protein n=1 Tax=Salinimicrobium sp. TIG7-5_MAKvit TaxID=3121289 RepID=UPI003C6DE550